MRERAVAWRTRDVETPAKAGAHESFYLTATIPPSRRSWWFRHTVLKPPGAPPRSIQPFPD